MTKHQSLHKYTSHTSLVCGNLNRIYLINYITNSTVLKTSGTKSTVAGMYNAEKATNTKFIIIVHWFSS